MVAEWSKAADCKSVSYSRIGSNPIHFIFIIKKNTQNQLTMLQSLKTFPNYNYKSFNKYKKIIQFKFSSKNNNKVFSNFIIINKILNNKNKKTYWRVHIKFLNSYLLLYTYKYTIFNINFFLKNNFFVNKSLLLNFKRFKFFPTLLNSKKNHTYITLSLGLFLSYFLKPKSFKKSKQLYILLITFFKKLLIHTQIRYLTLIVKFIPKYLTELITNLQSQNAIYLENTSLLTTNYNIIIKNIIFSTTKNYFLKKLPKKGKLKRKVVRKIIKNNSIID